MNATQAPQHRNKSVIVQNMFDLTCEMIGHLEDYEFLVDAIDRRQVLMDEFDRVKNSPDFLSGMDGTRTAEVSNMLSNMRDMDKTVIQALSRILLEAKKELAANNNQQKVMGYMNNMVSSSGSYMNYSR
ncbi:hypothetical protein U6B65_08255 [Oscillospiraceae bacterium MB08-C2-2]|nr:hypothetical protein U6B65_08255 [Oscillospiraceae bacterium MB08-C2-2]